ncbi:DUF1289 domain-containing protein [Methylophilus aquaticus]|uniref:DUF1289 domain-containing protein n=1 Tax=Methylophilus aquaticus TaxID=1971610 RepID=A0ABT9JVR0_9PROT|nr:DUF1289 domain-containing protein [Methylophilus aquaticus]MDP8568554.1 DUF1289 domain-containing protein [Methylophilus aquaticus]
MSEEEVQSPCIGVCTIDEANGFCQGCFRTLEEIQGWWDFDNVKKAEVVNMATQRETAAFD